MNKLNQLVSDMGDNKTLEKSGLLTVGVSLVSAGMAIVSSDRISGILMVISGVVCLIVRELVKLRT